VLYDISKLLSELKPIRSEGLEIEFAFLKTRSLKEFLEDSMSS
jgi:hypothetical protein